MEGVLVSARKDGSNITYTVVSGRAGVSILRPLSLMRDAIHCRFARSDMTWTVHSAVDIPPPAPIQLSYGKQVTLRRSLPMPNGS